MTLPLIVHSVLSHPNYKDRSPWISSTILISLLPNISFAAAEQKVQPVFFQRKKKNTVRATTRRPSNHPIRDVTRPSSNRSKWHISGLICFPRSSTREDQVIGFVAQRLHQNKCALWRHYLRTKEFWLIWSKTSPAQFVLMLRTIQSDAIAAGVSPSPAPSLGKWSCGFGRARATICCDFSSISPI